MAEIRERDATPEGKTPEGSGKGGKENEPVPRIYLQTVSTLQELVPGIQEQVGKWKELNVGKSWVTASSLHFGRWRKNYLLTEDVLNN